MNSRKIKDMLLGERKAGTSIFITTHDMWLANELCDRVAFLSSGKVSAMDARTALKKQYGKCNVQIDYLVGQAPFRIVNFRLCPLSSAIYTRCSSLSLRFSWGDDGGDGFRFCSLG